MQNKLKNYIIYLSILTLVMLVVYYFLRDQLSVQSAYIIPAYFIIMVVTHLFLMRAFSKDPTKFMNSFLAGFAFKMLASFAFLTIIFLSFKGITKDFVAVFMGVYFIYTAFELVYLKPLAKTPK